MRFSIVEFRVSGSALIPSGELQAVLQPLVGSGRSLEDLERARQLLLAAYRKRGYELLSVDYDARESRAGVHHFMVREVVVARVNVTGNVAFSADQVRRQFPSLTEGSTPNLNQLARELFLFNDNPAHNASLAYVPAAVGRTDVNIKVEEHSPVRVDTFANNTGSAATGRSRVGLTVHHDNLFHLDHQGSVTLVTSPEKPERVRQISASYEVPLPGLGDSVVFSVNDSDTDSGVVADVFSISGKSRILGVHFQHNLARDLLTRHLLDVGYEQRQYRDIVDYQGVNLGTSVTPRPLMAAYSYSTTSAADRLNLGLSLQINLPGGSRNDDATYAASRAGASAKWRTAQFSGSWQHMFASGWMSALRVAGQHANTPLISSEQFGLGGANGIRGLAEREGAGDRGVRAHAEIFSPVIAGSQRLLAFVDAGESTRLNAQAGETVKQNLVSYGLGWRLQSSQGVNVSLDAARVGRGTALHPRGTTRVHAAAAWSY